MKIAVVGTGYVGLSNAVLLAKKNEVIALDIDKLKIDLINEKKSPIADELLQHSLKNEHLNLVATQSKDIAYKDSKFIVIATPTDYDEDKNYFNTSSIENVLSDIESINPNAICIIRSTIPIGYTRKLRNNFKIKEIIFCPEFLREGTAFYDSLNPSRIILGSSSNAAKEFANILKSTCDKKNFKTFFMSSDESEAIKLFSNSYLAMRVAYFNELDNFCIHNKLNSKDIILGVSEDPRIGNFYNNPSFGYGGYCLPKDTKQLKSNFKDVKNSIISSIVSSNDLRKSYIAQTIIDLKPKTLGIFKLAMKSGSDNFRSSSILDICKIIQKNSSIKICIYEPSIKNNYFDNYFVETSIEVFKKNADIILTNRDSDELHDVKDKVFTRDIFNSD